MPDADDFDVDYFRTLLKGKSPGPEPAAPAAPKPARRKARPAAPKPAAGKAAKATRAKSAKR